MPRKTLSGVAHSYDESLLIRDTDVTLKEGPDYLMEIDHSLYKRWEGWRKQERRIS